MNATGKTSQRPDRFTLTELVVSSSILVITLTALAPLSLFVVTSYMRERVRNDLDAQSSVTTEWIKKDIASTSRGSIMMWPESSTGAVCLSFPVLRRGDGADDLPLDADGEIEWSQTIIYHMWTNSTTGKTELRRTVFNPRDNSLNATQRLYQLVYTWFFGDGKYGLYNTANANTQTLLKDVSSYRITSSPAQFDTYSPTHGREVVSMGTWTLPSGYQTFRFIIEGKNEASSGYNLGLDMLSLSATGKGTEAEYFVPPHDSSGASAVRQSMSEYPGWSNKSQLYFPASGPGAYFTLRLHNDMWLESTFASDTAVLDRTEVTFDHALGENICQMIGNRLSWEAAVQTFGGDRQPSPDGHENSTVRVIVNDSNPERGRVLAHRGRRGSVTFSASDLTKRLGIRRAYIMERANGYNGDPSTVRQLTFNDAAGLPGVTVHDGGQSIRIDGGHTAPSDHFDLPIHPDKTYIVSYQIGTTAGHGSPTIWPDTGSLVHSYEIRDDAANHSAIADWSGVPPEDITPHAAVLGVQSIWVTYPETATYTSEILDTRLANPAYMNINWTESTTASNSIKLRVRSGSQPDLSDASPWGLAPVFTDAGGTNSLSSLPRGRYLQWKAVLETTAPYTETAKLTNVLILWPGVRRGVDVGVAVQKKSDAAIFSLRVNGQDPSPAALNMRFTLAQSLLGTRYEKAFAVQGTPRNY